MILLFLVNYITIFCEDGVLFNTLIVCSFYCPMFICLLRFADMLSDTLTD